MCLFSEGDRVMRKGSVVVYTVARESMGWHDLVGEHGEQAPRIPGGHLMSMTEALTHHAAGLAAVAATLGDSRLVALAGEVVVAATLHAAPADVADIEVA